MAYTDQEKKGSSLIFSLERGGRRKKNGAAVLWEILGQNKADNLLSDIYEKRLFVIPKIPSNQFQKLTCCFTLLHLWHKPF